MRGSVFAAQCRRLSTIKLVDSMPTTKRSKASQTAKTKSAKKRSPAKPTRKAAPKTPAATDGPAAVDAYLAALPAEQRAALQALRELIKSVAPLATECISYQMPTFKHHGGLVSYAAFKKHCTLFVLNLHTIPAHAAALKAFSTAPSGIHFTPEKPLPAGLVRKIVRERMKENENR